MKSRFPLIGLFAVSLLLLAGCAPREKATATSSSRFKIVVQLDWIAEAEHGGFYQAMARGYFKDAGLDVVLDQGGPNSFGMQKVATNQANIAQSDSTNTLLAIAQGLPMVNIGAVFQNDPSVLMLHADNPVDSFEQLNGQTLMARPEWAFLPYLRKKYGIDFKLIPQNFSVSNFIVDKNFIQQGFYIAEPFYIIQGGAKPPKFLYAWDAGFDAYTVLVANRPWADKNADKVRAFMKAYIHGWADYLTGDPTPGNTLLKTVNPHNSDAFLAFSRQKIIDEHLVIGRVGGSLDQIGRITPERFKTQIGQLENLSIVPPNKLTVDQVMTTAYLP